MYILVDVVNTLSVERGYNNTKKATHTTGLDVFVYRTFTVQREVNGTTAASHTNAAVYQYVPPADINWLCRQMVGLMMKKAKSGFAGKVGSAELGEVFYQNEFPKDPIAKIKANYRLTKI
jgi:hypothetical protein